MGGGEWAVGNAIVDNPMKLTKQISKTSRDLSRTIIRVIVMNWRVSPTLYIIQLILNVVLGFVPLLSAGVAGLSLGAISSYIAGQAISRSYLDLLVGGVVALGLISTQLGYLESYIDQLFQVRFDGYIQRQLFQKFASLDQSYYEDRDFNNKLNKINQNIYSLRSLNKNLFSVVSAIVSLVTAGVAVFILKPILVVIIIIAILPVLIIEVQTSMKRWRNWDEKGDDWRRQWYLRWMLLDVNRIKEIKLYLLGDFFLDKWQHHFDASRKTELAIEKSAQKQRALSGFVDAGTQIGIQLWLLGKVLARNGFGLGQFVFYRQVIQGFSVASSMLVSNLHNMQENSLYVNDYFDVLALESRLPQPKQAIKLTSKVPRIEFRDVSFSYPKSKQKVIKHLSFVIEPGEDVALVGENGVGKSTIVKLLMRFYDPTEGQILVDGHDLKDVDPKTWYTHVGVLFQDFNQYIAFSASDNIAVGRVGDGGGDKTIKAAADLAGASSYISKYETGFDTILDKSYKGGAEPSGGQWQRIALARAFYRQASVMILDEPTSAIDAKGEYEIFKRIAESQKTKTTIIISHRFSAVRNAHKILVLENGELIQAGTHQELVASDGLYRTMFELQAEGYR